MLGAAVHVSGKAVVYVVPDEVILTVGVENTHKDVEVAQSENERVVTAAKKVCANL